ncbi:MAG: porin family protein [Acetobacter sp.]|nr:porin family protein [Acetobacter sp.]
MRKLLMLAGIFTVLAYNAQARYYEENGYYYEEQPRYEQRQVRYREEPKYTRQSPQYRRITREEERNYNERRYMSDNSNTIRPYIGLDVATTSMKFGTDQWVRDYDGNTGYFEDGNKAISGVLGVKINKYFGVEAFYQQSGEEKHRDNTFFESTEYDGDEDYDTTTISYKAFGVDLLGYIPVTQDIEIITSLGLAQYDFDTNLNMSALNSDTGEREKYLSESKSFDSLGFRIGLGAQYSINEHFALRAMARYVKMDDDEYVKSLTEFSLGLRYMF